MSIFRLFNTNKLLFVLLLFFSISPLESQITSTGKDFWFNFMHNHETPKRTYDLNIFISSDVDASGTVSVPGRSWSENFTVSANSTAVVKVPTDVGHVTIADAISNQGIHITSDNDINVFAMNYSLNTTDGSLILPTNAIGSSYYILSYEPVTGRNSGFSIVAVENNTTVRIIPSKATTGGHPAGVAYDVTLAQGQVYQVESSDDLTGSRVYALGGKKIAVFGGAQCVNIPPGYVACDHLFEQMFPNNTLRRNFVAIPYATRKKGDTYRILAIQNNTVVTFNGGSPINLNAGQWQELILKDPTFISSNFPISVAQYSNGTGFDGVTDADPFFIMLSPVEQTREDITFEVFNFPNIKGNYVNIATKTSCTSGIRLDGNPVAGWKVLPGNPVYSYVQVSVTQGHHRLVSSSDCGFNAYVYGYGPADSYGYSAGVRLDTLAINITKNTNCAGAGTEFHVSSSPYPIVQYRWYFGDGDTSSLEKPVHVYQRGGTYTVTLYVTYDNGEKGKVEQNFNITEARANFGYSGGVCGSKTVQFQDQSKVINGKITDWSWDFGDGGSAMGPNPSHEYADYSTYRVILKVTTSQGCEDYDTLYVEVIEPPTVDLGADVEICLFDSVQIGNTATLGTPPYRYSWTPSTGLSADDEAIVSASPNQTTDYILTVFDANDCEAYDTIRVVVLPLPQPRITPRGPIEICSCDSVMLDAGDGFIDYLWSNGDTTQTTIVNYEGDYTVTVTDTNGCVNTSPPVHVDVIYPQATVTFGTPSYSVTPGGIIDVPVRIVKSMFLDRCNSNNFVLDISFNKYIMVPTGNTPTGVFDNDLRRIQITGKRDPETDTLVILRFMGTLGDVEQSALTVDSFYWTDCDFPEETIASEVNLIGLCEEGGTTRLYRSPSDVMSFMIKPNPMSGESKITFELTDKTPVKIMLIDVARAVSRTLTEKLYEKGEHELLLNVEDLSNGMYLMVLQTPDGTLSILTEVLK